MGSIKDRNTYARPALPTLGAAGYQFTDPIFGSRITRLTDQDTCADITDMQDFSYRTPSASYQNMWSGDGRRLFTGTNGAPVLFDWNPDTRVGTRRGTTLNFFSDIAFHDSNPDYIYGGSSAAGATNHHTIIRADVSSIPPTYTLLFNADDLVPGLAARGDTYLGTVAVSNNILLTICGGAGQGEHDLVIWYPLANPSAVKVLNTLTAAGMDHFTMHSAQLDKSGRYIDMVPLLNDQYRNYIWDTTLDTVTPVYTNSGGHEVLGYQARINQDVITTYDNIQAILTPDLGAPNDNKRELIFPVMTPTEAYIDMHISWNCAQPDQLVPCSAETSRTNDGPQDVPQNTVPWRPWDNEIISIRTDGLQCDVWRHCHHRSDAFRDDAVEGPTIANWQIFYYTVRANMDPTGRYIAFTSNWEKTLGTEPSSTIVRQDVFIVERLLDDETLPFVTQLGGAFV